MSCVWPLPSTPAMPTISPACTVSETPATAGSPRSSSAWRSSTLRRALARRAGRLVDPQEDLAPDHPPRELLLGRAGSRKRLDHLPAAQDRDPVGDLEHLVQLVADEDDREPLLAQHLEYPEELGSLLRRQHRGRLVQDQDVRLAVQRLDDLDALLLTDGDLVDPCIRVDCEAEVLRQVEHALARGVVVEQDAHVTRLHPEHDVLGDGHHRDQHEVLVHHADPEVDRGSRRVDPHLLPVEQDLRPRPGGRARRGCS